MKQNIISALLLIASTIAIYKTIDYPTLQVISASVWCFTLFLLIKNIIETIIKNKKQ
jgi:hypothetical protein